MRKVKIVLTQIVLTFLFIIIGTYTYAADFAIPHQFNSGDVLSANQLNEIFYEIRETEKTLTEQDLIGSWSCNSYLKGGAQSIAVAGWVADADTIVTTLSGSTLNFLNDGDGTFTLTSSSPNPFHSEYLETVDTPFRVFANRLFFRMVNSLFLEYTYIIKQNGSTRITLIPDTSSVATVICDRQEVAPIAPSTLTADASSLTVSLSWTDESTDETSFNLYRRDTLTGDYNVIASPSADATSYTDTLTSAGTYWYRVAAVNANGESLGSNVVKVEVE